MSYRLIIRNNKNEQLVVSEHEGDNCDLLKKWADTLATSFDDATPAINRFQAIVEQKSAYSKVYTGKSQYDRSGDTHEKAPFVYTRLRY
ncbi:hypothetical protein [uncultured Mediterranean phage]|nr:hypothetical protein [uncultured Mediterranean phage]